jgi:hypothetical protein
MMNPYDLIAHLFAEELIDLSLVLFTFFTSAVSTIHLTSSALCREVEGYC